MIDRAHTSAVAALAAMTAAALVHAPLEAQAQEAPERPGREEVRTIRINAPGARGGWLGVRVEDLDREEAVDAGLEGPRGARVISVREDAPADRAGLEEGDVVVRFDGEEVRSVAHLTRLVRETPAGREVSLRVLRDGEARDLSLEVGERPGPRVRVRAGPDWDRLEDRFQHLEGEMDEERLEEMRERMERAREIWERRMEEVGDSAGLVAPRVRMMRLRDGGPPRLGVRMQPLTDQLAEHFGVGDRGGVLVAAVREGSAAADAGLEAGDVIVRLGDRDVGDPGDLAEAVSEAGAGPVPVTLVRDGEERTLTVEMPEREEVGWMGPGEEGDGRAPLARVCEDDDCRWLGSGDVRMVSPGEVDVHWNVCDAGGCRRWPRAGVAPPSIPAPALPGPGWIGEPPAPDDPGREILAPAPPAVPSEPAPPAPVRGTEPTR